MNTTEIYEPGYDRAVRPSELQKILGLSRSSIHRLEESGQLPQKRRFKGGAACFYLLSELVNFLKAQPTASEEANK